MLSPEAGEITFGNGRYGRVPPAGAKIEVTYQVGGGPGGNVAPGTLKQILVGAHNDAIAPEADRDDLVISQPFAATGGAPVETLAQAKGRAVASLAERRRAITLPDFEALALATPGVRVAHAHALADYHPRSPCLPALGSVTVVVLPDCPDDPLPLPSPEMLQAVERYLNRRRTVGTEVHVIGPNVITVGVSARLHTEPGVDAKGIAEQAQKRLDEFLHPLRGGPEGKGWPVGREVYRSEVMAVLSQLEGVAQVDEVSFQTESQFDPSDGSLSFVHTSGEGQAAITLDIRLRLEPDADSGDVVEKARAELDPFMAQMRKRPSGAAVALGREAYRAELTALLLSLPGVQRVESVSVQTGSRSEARCGNVSVCPHGLVAAGQHHIATGERKSAHE